MKAAGQIAMQARHSNGTDMSSRDVEAIARALDAERAKVWEEAAESLPSKWLDPLVAGLDLTLAPCPLVEEFCKRLATKFRSRAAEVRR